MSDTTAAAVRRLRDEMPVVHAVARQVRRQVDPERAERIVEFAELLFSKAPSDLVQERSADALAHMVLGAYRFLDRARPDRVNVEVFNPDVDNEGWYAPVTVVRTNVSERPFIVDTIREYLHSRGLTIEHYVYPVLHVERDDDGHVVRVAPSSEGEHRESLVHCEVTRVTDPSALEEIRSELGSRLQDVVAATSDFGAMLEEVDHTIEYLRSLGETRPDGGQEIEEIVAFLEWLQKGHFVFLGYRSYDLVNLDDDARGVQVEPGSGLGILRDETRSRYARPVPVEELPRGLLPFVLGGPLLIISKTNAESTVHRRARMDYVGVKKIDERGEVVGEHRFLGLFTSRAYAESAEDIPILRRKLEAILEGAGVLEGTHDYKEINTIFNSLPKEELFLSSAEEIGEDIQAVLTAYHTEEVRVTLRDDPLKRGVSVMVIMPKERFSGEVRREVEEAFVDLLEGEVLNYHLALGEGDQARLHFFITAPDEALESVDAGVLERAVQELIRSWSDRIREGLERVRPPDEARRLARVYADAFSPEYAAATQAPVAVRDILELELLGAEERDVSISIANPESAPTAAEGQEVTELKLYLRGGWLVLSDFMPILESCGLRVIGVTPYHVDGEAVEPSTIYSFAVQDEVGERLAVDERGDLLANTILAVRRGDVSNDAFNQLVLKAGLSWRQVDVLRTYATYAFQLGAVPSRLAIPSALVRYPGIARLLFDLFRRRFDPDLGMPLEEREEVGRDIQSAFHESLRGVTQLADDRALRRMETLIQATVRTNYYRVGGDRPRKRSGGVPYLSLKFASGKLESIVRTRLLYEVWVRSSRMEGVHLRGAKVARGGIRYSDRPDDFRTEVFGLVSTQMVKNAVIVPAGSKGGFITLRTLTEPEEMAEEAREQYRTLVRGLLDITDNLVDGEVAPPDEVIAYDDPDPYLVVAADKGTAKYSDLANEIAAEYDFWLGDAFASGGSNGYDHKAVGITARGAWECVKRHFREKGKDIQSEAFTVAGLGDMSGDVFGNGMLLSRQTRLVAAFDHRHVFIDPDPDPGKAYKERQRLFALPRSSWADYDVEVLSEGGMIVPRGAKETPVTPEVRRALGIPEEVETLDGEALIRAVLRAPVELLWNGGIGTYVKASSESHADAGDPTNDPVRVDAGELRCEVVGEGGNLGLTQAARVEYALAGGRINTDALDNAGGVDLSDREVNLKILLSIPVSGGRMSLEERNLLLERLTEAEAALVLADSAHQSLAISLDELRAADAGDDFRDFLTSLERGGALDRVQERLPTLETLVERSEEGLSFVRPELCVLLAHAKLDLMSHLLRSDLPDDPALRDYLTGYFPPEAVEAAGEEGLERHSLHREIVSSQLTNDLVDLMGATFVHRLVRDTGRTRAEVARAWLVAARLAGHRELLARMLGKEPELPSEIVYRWLLGLSRVLERTARWLLANVDEGVSTTELIEGNIQGFGALRRRFGEIVAGEDLEVFEARVAELRDLGVSDGFARELITLRFLDQVLEVLRVARTTRRNPVGVARAYYFVSDLLNVPWLRRSLFRAAKDDRWEQRAVQALAEDLNRAHHHLTARVLAAHTEDSDEGLRSEAERIVFARPRDAERYTGLVEELRAEDEPTLHGLSAVVRELSQLAERARNGTVI